MNAVVPFPDAGKGKATEEDPGWEDPIPLSAQSALPDFPLNTLPGYIGAMVEGVAEELQVPADLPGALALAVLATAAGGRAEVTVRGQWREPLNLFVAVAMPPGSGKSPAFRAMMTPVFLAETRLQEATTGKIKEKQRDRSLAIAQAEEARRKAKDPQDIEAALDALRMAEEITVPVMPRLTADDINPEQAATLMADQGGRLAILSAEGTFVEVIMGRYSNGKPNLELVLKGHVGDRVQVDRRGREEFIERPALTIGIAIQPDMLKEMSAKKQMHGRGAMARFLFSLPPDLVGSRKITPETVSEDVIRTYRDTLADLIVDLADWADDPANIPLTPPALKLHTEWRAEIEPRLKRGTGDLEALREWASKLPGATVRLAGLLHLAENPKNGPRTPISEDTMARAIDLSRYYVAHACAAFGVMRAHPGIEDARAVLEKLNERDDPRANFTLREIHRSMHRRFERAADAANALTLLEDHGYIRRVPDTSTGGRRSVQYEVNPQGAVTR